MTLKDKKKQKQNKTNKLSIEQSRVNMEGAALSQSCVSPKTTDQEVSQFGSDSSKDKQFR